jgi:hypothetical protein
MFLVRRGLLPFAAFLALLGLVAASALVGCSYTHHQGVLANGASSQLYFTGAGSSSAAADLLAVGYAAKIVVARYGPGDVPCTGLGLHKNNVSSGEVGIQGGDLGDPDHCASLPADGVSLVSATCADDTCSVAADTTDPRAVTLTITGAHAGATRLVVALKSAADGKTYDDSIAMRFAVPARIRIAADARHVDAMNGPVLPGVEITRPRAEVVDADNAVLEIGDGALTSATEGDAYADSPEFSRFTAKYAGHTVLRWTYPGVPDRTVDLEVVDPTEAHALFVYAPLPRSPSGTAAIAPDLDPVDAPPPGEPATGRITSIELAQNDFGTFPFRVKLADGRFALAAVDDPALVPAALGYATSGLDLSAFDVEGTVVGQGTVTLRAAPGASATLAVKVTARPAPSR